MCTDNTDQGEQFDITLRQRGQTVQSSPARIIIRSRLCGAVDFAAHPAIDEFNPQAKLETEGPSSFGRRQPPQMTTNH